MTRDFRDAVIEEFADRELALRHQWRFERAALLDRLDAQAAEIARLRHSLATLRADVMRYTASTVAGVAA